jgi:chemotaxis protein MotB
VLSSPDKKAMARKKQEERVNHGRWLVSYADFVTLLFAFFVVMFAASQTDKSKAQAVSDSVKKALEGESFNNVVNVILGGNIDRTGRANAQKKGPGGDVQPAKPDDKKSQPMVELAPSLDILTKQLAPEIKAGKLQISMVPRGLAISFTQAALFPSGGDEIAQETYPSIRKIAEAMQKIPNPARMEGHTDAIPIHNSRFHSNWELSAARSIALLELIKTFGVAKDRLSIGGYGDTNPVDDNNTEQGRAKNRRVDIIVLNQTGLKGEPEKRSLQEAGGGQPQAPGGRKQ